MSASSGFIKRSLYHGWVPATPVIHRQFLRHHFENLPRSGEYSTAVTAFLQVLDDRGIRDDIEGIFNKAVVQAAEYKNWADENYEVKDFTDFLDKVNQIVTKPPQFYKAVVDGNTTIGEPVGVPIYLIFDLISNTSAAYTLLNRDDFNVALRALLYQWGLYLANDPTSNSTLNDGEHGWFSKPALAVLESGLGKLSFLQTYKTDNPDLPYYNSWDSFFVRQFNENDPEGNPVRPIPDQPSGGPFYLYNPCESTVFRTATDVRLRDTFWLKSQKYSLYDMLGGDAHNTLSHYAERLEGGSVLQSFLSPQDFHRWHSPIKGTILASDVIAGTYYAVLPDEGAPESDPDLLPGDPHGAMIRSQPWLSVAATRAVFIIEPGTSDPNSPIDLIAFVGIGMVEVSSCDITRPSGDINVGDEIGTFHFGGSSFTLVVKLKDNYKLVFQDIFNSPVRPGQHRWIHSVVGQIFTLA